MTIRTATPSCKGDKFPDAKIIRFLEVLKQARFSGQLIWTTTTDSRKWNFYFHLGYLCYATGGLHQVRRWVRALSVCCPHLQIDISQLRQVLHSTAAANFVFGWEYYLLGLWVEQRKLTQTQANQIIRSIFSEVLLDLLQVPESKYEIKQFPSVPDPLVGLNEKQVFAEVQQFWQNLRNHNIEPGSLDKAPIVKHPERLQGWMSEAAYRALPQLLDGEKTLHDLAIQARVNVVQVARSLMPYIRSGLVELTDVSDLPAPIHPSGSNKVPVSPELDRPLIACVDDSTIVCWTMEKLLTAAGYQFIGINDGFRAITALLQHKPSLIFLDVFMPGTNGYEICRNLRKAPSFQQIPIVFLTGLDGVVDQVRARLAGASDFLSKPIEAQRVLSVVSKHLPKEAMIP